MLKARHSVMGKCDPRFQEVQDEFERNFSQRSEAGASVCVYLDGEPVVDLWGGTRDLATGEPWQQDTIAPVFSCTKGMMATCVHILADRGLLDFEAPVARYWPEFAAAGKSGITVAMLLSHQAGLPLWQRPLPDGALLDWSTAVATLVDESPLWEPGSRHGYHSLTFGYLAGELIRRISGLSVSAFLQREIAGPLDADIWIALPEREDHRVATLAMAGPDVESKLFVKIQNEPEWIGIKSVTNVSGWFESLNTPAFLRLESPAGSGIANARGLATMYAPLSLDGTWRGVELVKKSALPLMRQARSMVDVDQILRIPTSFSLGYSKSWGGRDVQVGQGFTIGENAFGASGLGGSIGFADGEARMSFGYVMNQHAVGLGLDERGQSLIDAAYRAVGFAGKAPGFWIS